MTPASPENRSRLVYTSETGRTCPDCEKAIQECRCRRKTSGALPPRPRATGTSGARVRREVGGRGGKTVTVIADLNLTHEELSALAGCLKKKLGTGGAVKNGLIEIQGDHRDAIIAELSKQGIPAKKAGG
jgi:translation initiation factor 1